MTRPGGRLTGSSESCNGVVAASVLELTRMGVLYVGLVFLAFVVWYPYRMVLLRFRTV